MNEDLPTRLSHLKHLVKAKKNKPEFKPEEIKPELESEEIKPEFKPEPKKWLLTCGTYFNLNEGIKKCPVCNNQVTPLVGKGRPRKYCSRKCAKDDHARKIVILIEQFIAHHALKKLLLQIERGLPVEMISA